MVKVLLVSIVFLLKGFAISDTKPVQEVRLATSQIAELGSAETVTITFEHAKIRSCKNNVKGYTILVNGVEFGKIEVESASLTRTGDLTVTARKPGPIFTQQTVLEFKPIWTDSGIDGCYSLSARVLRITANGQ